MTYDLAQVIIGAFTFIASVFIAISAQRIVKSQYKLAAADAVEQWLTEVHTWSKNVIDILSEARFIVSNEGSVDFDEVALRRCRFRLSGYIDLGRLYFPNIDETKHGLHKEEAYKGYRHPIIGILVTAYSWLEYERGKFVKQTNNRSKELYNIQHSFVARVHSENHTREFKELISVLMHEAGIGADGL